MSVTSICIKLEAELLKEETYYTKEGKSIREQVGRQLQQ